MAPFINSWVSLTGAVTRGHYMFWLAHSSRRVLHPPHTLRSLLLWIWEDEGQRWWLHLLQLVIKMMMLTSSLFSWWRGRGTLSLWCFCNPCQNIIQSLFPYNLHLFSLVASPALCYYKGYRNIPLSFPAYSSKFLGIYLAHFQEYLMSVIISSWCVIRSSVIRITSSCPQKKVHTQTYDWPVSEYCRQLRKGWAQHRQYDRTYARASQTIQ